MKKEESPFYFQPIDERPTAAAEKVRWGGSYELRKRMIDLKSIQSISISVLERK